MVAIKKDVLSNLAKIALVGSVGVAISGYMFERNFQARARETSTYQKALEILRNNKKTVEHFGEPIKEGKLKFDTDAEIKKLSVFLRGKNTKGVLDCDYIVKPDKKTEIVKAEVKFADIPNKKVILYRV